MKRIILSCWIIGCCCLFFSNNVLAQLLPPASSCGYTVVPATVPATTVVCINGTLDLPDDPGTTAPNYAYVITDPNNLIDPDGVPGSGDEEESIVGTVEETAPGTYVIDPVALGLVEGQSYCVTGFGFDLANINTIIQGVYVSAFCTFAVACVDNGDPSDDFCQACADGPPAPASFTTLQELFDFAAAVSGSADVSIESVLGIIELIEGLTAALAVPAPCYSISGLQEYCVDVVPASDAACVEDVCPTVLVDFNDPSTLPNLPSGVCVGDMIDLCFITDCSDCDLTAVDFQYTVAGAADPGFTPVQTDSVVCFQTTVPAGTGDPCAAYDLAITIVSVNTNDPQCTTGNVGYDIQNSPLGTLVGENINDVIPFLAFADANPIVVTVYPNLEVAVTGPDCDGNGGMAQLLAGTTECAVTMGTGGMTNVCPDQNGTAGELLWDFTANVDSAICITGAPLVGGIIADCIVPCCLDCSDVTCTTTMPCDDNDCSTENDEMVILTIDGSVCTVCAGTPVTPPTCNTTEVCDGAGGVTTEVYNPANCMCEVMVVDPPVCDDTVVCDGNGNLTSEQYNPATCQCEAVAVPQVPCDDGDCTNGVETYDLMTCQCLPGTPPVDPGCDDGDCTNGVETWDGCACVAGTPPVDPGCDDGDCSNGVETWDGCACVAGTPPVDPGCDDGDCSNGVETWDGCACVAGTPGEIPVCDDGDCSNGVETYDAANCQCVAGTPPVDPGCDDGDCSNGVETWDGCACVAGTPPVDPGCDDGDCSNGVETWDGCACVAGTPPVDPGCDDGDCTNGVETWDGCACVAGTPGEIPVCDDGDCSNGLETYDAANCQCVAGTPPVDPGCDDGDCTNGLEMWDGCECVAGTPNMDPGCDDGDCSNGVETWDGCACVAGTPPVDPGCDDGDCSNGVETWDGCACVAGTPPVDPGCDDGDCNTSDMYDAASCQCVFTPIPEPSCDDSDCTTDDSYDAASCTCINTPVAPPVCNTDPCAGDIETYDASTCTCVVSEAQVFGCTDALAVNFDATANCDDASCVYTSVEITDPCACGNPANVDLAPADGIIDFVIDTITITSTPGETWTLSSNTPAASGSSAVLSDGATSAVGTVAVETTPGQYVLVVYYPANGSGFGTLVFTEAGGTMIDITKADGFGCNCNPMAGCNPFFDAGPIEINRVCAGNALYVVDPNDPSGIAAYPADQYTTFEWFDAAGMPVATTIGHAYFSPSVVGTYTVQVTDINSCAQFNLTATGAPYAVTEIIDCTGCGDE